MQKTPARPRLNPAGVAETCDVSRFFGEISQTLLCCKEGVCSILYKLDADEMMVGFLLGAFMAVLRFVSAVWHRLRSPLVGPLHGSNPTAEARALTLQLFEIE